MKKRVKQIVSAMLITMMAFQVLPMSVFTANAAEVTGATWTDETTGIMYEYYGDISEFRTKTEDSYLKHPEEAGYVFAGWWTEESVSSTTGISDSAEAISVDKTDEGAWAKFVPEDVLTVKAQTSMKVSDALDKEGAVDEYGNLTANNGKGIKLRLVTSVDDNELYDEIGFKVKINSEQRIASNKFFEELTVTEAEGASKINPKEVFDAKASAEFAVLVIGGFKTVANVNETALNVTPYWKTLDGTIVDGTNRARLLASDERANDEDGSGSDFTVAGNKETYTYGLNTVAETVSYKYFLGASDSVYLKSAYTPSGANEKFGITIRNGGQTRQVLFSNAGVVITDGTVAGADATYDNLKADATNKAYVWATKGTTTAATASTIMTMLGATTETEVIWAIDDNVLYCSVGGDVVLSIPMNVLCDKWLPGSYYQLGVAAYNVAANETSGQLVFTKATSAFGKNAVEKFVVENDDVATKENVVFEPITGSYKPAMKSGITYCYGEGVVGTQVMKATLKTEALKADTGSSSFGLVVYDSNNDKSAQIIVEGLNIRTRVLGNYTWDTRFEVQSWIRAVAKAYTDDGVCEVTAVVKDYTLYIMYNDVLAGSVDLYKIISGYQEAHELQLGICTWDSYQCAVSIQDIEFATGETAVNNLGIHNNYEWEIFKDAKELQGRVVITGEKNVAEAYRNTNGTKKSIYSVATSMPQMMSMKVSKTATDNVGEGFTVKCGDESVQIVVMQTGRILMTMYCEDHGNTRHFFNGDTSGTNVLNAPWALTSSPWSTTSPYNYQVTVVVNNENVYIMYNNGDKFVIPLTEMFKNYTSGDEVSLGLYAYGWVNVTFTNVAFSAGQCVEEYYTNNDCASITKTFAIRKN